MRGKDKNGATALMVAAQAGHAEVVKVLLENGADVNATDGEGSTGLMYAAKHGHLATAKLLLERGADVNAETANIEGRWTALKEAAWGGNAGVVKLLIEKGADVNVKDEQGWTALMAAGKTSRETAWMPPGCSSKTAPMSMQNG